jgi:hypothetical protein
LRKRVVALGIEPLVAVGLDVVRPVLSHRTDYRRLVEITLS